MVAGFGHEAFTDPGYHDPAQRLKAMDRDGVEAEILYSEVSAFRHYPHMKDGWKEASEAFNRFMLDFASADAARLVPAYQVPLMDIEFAVEQIEGLAAEGARAIHIPTFPSEVGLPEYHDARYDPVWSAISASGVGQSALGARASLWDLFRRDPTPQKAIFTSQPAMRLAETIGFWILPGRAGPVSRPQDRPGRTQSRLDTALPARVGSMAEGPYEFPELNDKPSCYFHRQMYLTFVDDARGLEHRHELGVDRIMWSTDFPHPATSWPNSQGVVEKNFEGIPTDERDLIVAGNAARVYGL